MKNEKKSKAPKHLADATRRWWRDVVSGYVLEPQHLRLLQLACESWDRGQEARLAIAKDGPFVSDRFGVLHAHPGVSVERDCRIAFARLIRELDLDVEAPPARPTQPPLLRRYGGK